METIKLKVKQLERRNKKLLRTIFLIKESKDNFLLFP